MKSGKVSCRTACVLKETAAATFEKKQSPTLATRKMQCKTTDNPMLPPE